MTNKIRSAGSPLIKDHEKGLRMGGFELNWIGGIWVSVFGGKVREGERT
jgi:hypothetical protein